MPQQLLTLDQTAKVLLVSYHRAAELARAGILPTARLGGQVRVDPGRLEAFIAEGGIALSGRWQRLQTPVSS